MVKQNFQKTDNPVQTFFKTPIFRSWGPILVAAVLWFLMFSIWTKHLFNFWIGIAISASVLMVVAIILRKEILKQFQWTWNAIGFGLLAAGRENCKNPDGRSIQTFAIKIRDEEGIFLYSK